MPPGGPVSAGLIALTFGATLAVAVAMEGWAALLHGYVWHRALWRIHRTHHRRRRARFEANDLLSALHAPVAIALIVHGCRSAPGIPRALEVGLGLGMTLFGLAYLICHDGLVHRRLPVRFLARSPYLARVARAHRLHHALGGAPYGFFAAPLALRLSGHERPRARSGGPSAPAARPGASAAPLRRRTDDAPRPPAGSG